MQLGRPLYPRLACVDVAELWNSSEVPFIGCGLDPGSHHLGSGRRQKGKKRSVICIQMPSLDPRGKVATCRSSKPVGEARGRWTQDRVMRHSAVAGTGGRADPEDSSASSHRPPAGSILVTYPPPRWLQPTRPPQISPRPPARAA